MKIVGVTANSYIVELDFTEIANVTGQILTGGAVIDKNSFPAGSTLDIAAVYGTIKSTAEAKKKLEKQKQAHAALIVEIDKQLAKM